MKTLSLLIAFVALVLASLVVIIDSPTGQAQEAEPIDCDANEVWNCRILTQTAREELTATVQLGQDIDASITAAIETAVQGTTNDLGNVKSTEVSFLQNQINDLKTQVSDIQTVAAVPDTATSTPTPTVGSRRDRLTGTAEASDIHIADFYASRTSIAETSEAENVSTATAVVKHFAYTDDSHGELIYGDFGTEYDTIYEHQYLLFGGQYEPHPFKPFHEWLTSTATVTAVPTVHGGED